MALHLPLPIGSLKICSGLEPVPRGEPSNYQPISHCAIGQHTLRLLPIPVGLLVLPWTHQCRRSPLTPSPLFFPVPDRGTCACDRCAQQQFVLDVHVKHSDLTWSTYSGYICTIYTVFALVHGIFHKSILNKLTKIPTNTVISHFIINDGSTDIICSNVCKYTGLIVCSIKQVSICVLCHTWSRQQICPEYPRWR